MSAPAPFVTEGKVGGVGEPERTGSTAGRGIAGDGPKGGAEMRMHNRIIKAAFWTDTELIRHLDRDGRMFYIGLIQLADDSGCLEDDLLAFKIHLYPADMDVDLEFLQRYRDKLIELGKLIPYEAEGKKCLYLKNFHKHQSLRSPSPPEVPLPPWITWQPAETPRSAGRYIVGDPYGHRTVTVRSPYGDQIEKEIEIEIEKEKKENIASASDDAGCVDDRTVTVKKTKEKNGNNSEDVQRVMDEYNRIFAGLWSRPLTLTADRKRKIQARLKTFTVDELVTAIQNIRASPFHCGDNDRGQVYATPEFIFRNDGQVDKWLKMEVKRNGRSGTDSEGTRKHGKYDDLVLR